MSWLTKALKPALAIGGQALGNTVAPGLGGGIMGALSKALASGVGGAAGGAAGKMIEGQKKPTGTFGQDVASQALSSLAQKAMPKPKPPMQTGMGSTMDMQKPGGGDLGKMIQMMLQQQPGRPMRGY